jgi:uncharacterized RDD family membrane protein YckC
LELRFFGLVLKNADMEYHIARNGQALGVFAEQDVRSKLLSGEFQPSDLCWTEGMADWRALGTTDLGQSASQAQAQASHVFNPYAPPVAAVAFRRSAEQEAPLATLGQRLGAAMLDGFVGIPIAVPIVVGISRLEQNESDVAGMILIGVGVIGILGLIVYNLVLLITKGQTIGKKWLNIRIADYQTNENPGFVKAFLMRGVVNWLIQMVPILGMFYPIVDICFIFREDRRCIHDLIAGTHVVQGSLP